MEFKFNSVEEVLEFASKVKAHAATTPGVVRPGEIDPAGLVTSLAAIARGNKIQAIKVYRAVVDCGLKAAKEAVERAPEFAPRPFTPTPAVDYGCGDPDCGCGPDDYDDTPF